MRMSAMQRSKPRFVVWRLFVSLVPVLLGIASPDLAPAELASFAFVQDDGSLRLKGRTIRLYGVYIPPSGTTCRGFERPPKCASRAALALDFKKGANFVHCEPKARNADGSITALCRVKGDDLSAYLLERGWAVALPDAPFEYATLEKIARHRGVGIWGLPLDNVPPPRRRQ